MDHEYYRRVICNSAYQLPKGAQDFIECYPNGTWTNPPSCQNVDLSCVGNPILVDGFFVEANFGDKIQLQCKENYRLVGNPFAICQRDGSWNISASCVRIQCDSQFPTIANGRITPNLGFDIGSRVFFNCQPNFTTVGENFAECVLDNGGTSGKWELKGQCQLNVVGDDGGGGGIRCGRLPLLPNGSLSTNSFEVGSVATVSCGIGYNPQGRGSSIICQSSGQWSPLTTTCVLRMI